MTRITVQEAVERLTEELATSSDYAFSWNANIAMALYDNTEGVSLTECNIAARNFLSNFTNAKVDTTMIDDNIDRLEESEELGIDVTFERQGYVTIFNAQDKDFVIVTSDLTATEIDQVLTTVAEAKEGLIFEDDEGFDYALPPSFVKQCYVRATYYGNTETDEGEEE